MNLKLSFSWVGLAVFALPILCAALWMHNAPAAVMMLLFGAAHLTVSLQSFR